ncbi:uncharacterized protein FOMMEDRAFT_136829 [Fomitiporia mediterranea MF3/22]|uniref:uncharacterized protein n=1 Tax=Fomitiporia mediterranea (strain MF3/22) TaxID=694068 RepID=UPI0004409678|nr:uncharacterized protein FOMMEDRAFT_136829 [Fomitiporia mediterranea MF3/22]EJC98592.1 hypothetical protein FOMMEDRAFT_136829 [Fomitiporia mediterranea MF3/22]
MRLPSIKHIQSTPLADLCACIKYLRFLYNPEVRGSRRRKLTSLGTKESKTADRLKIIRADAFEQSHAIRWLTALVARGDNLILTELDSEARECLVEDAAALLAACAGTASSGPITRSYTFGPSPLGEEVSLKLRDAPIENGDYGTVGAQTWGGACVIADMILEDPDRFGLPLYGSRKKMGEPFRIIELGAGTGLVGLTVAKLLELRHVRTEIVLSDFHPSILNNLRSNVGSTFPSTNTSCVDVSVVPLDWSSYSSASADSSLGTFDLVLGADIVYESTHAVWIKGCLQKLLQPNAYFHLVIPLRHTHSAESSTVNQVFGDSIPDPVFVIVDQEQFSCDAHSDTDLRMVHGDRAVEVEYAYYKINWKSSSE